MNLVGFGDRWEAHNLPWLLAEHVADEVVLVEPLHDDDDGATALVIEPAVEGMDEPLVAGLPQRLGERVLGFQRVIDQNEVGATSGQYPAGRRIFPTRLSAHRQAVQEFITTRQGYRLATSTRV